MIEIKKSPTAESDILRRLLQKHGNVIQPFILFGHPTKQQWEPYWLEYSETDEDAEILANTSQPKIPKDQRLESYHNLPTKTIGGTVIFTVACIREVGLKVHKLKLPTGILWTMLPDVKMTP